MGGLTMALLVTGGAGFIGSHTCVELLNSDEEIVVLDNYYNSSSNSLDEVKKITGKDFKIYEADLLDMPALDRIFDENDIEAVVHFAGYKSETDSCAKPLVYYSNNLRGTFNLLETMKTYGCTKFIFSSSGSVYGNPYKCPVDEDAPLKAKTPYASTKIIIENLLREMYDADNTWTMLSLRYCYAAGAHASGLLGEEHSRFRKSLMSEILDVACKERDSLEIGGGYPTLDGSKIRDYIHVTDLAKGHVAAVKKARETKSGCRAYNLGTGKGVSSIVLLELFQSINNVKIDYTVGTREDGVATELVLDPSRANKELNWKAEHTIEEICRDAWNYRKNKH